MTVDPRAPTFIADFIGYLVQSNVIDAAAGARASRAQRQTHQPIQIVLTELGLVSTARLQEVASGFFCLSTMSTRDFPAEPLDLPNMPAHFLRQTRLLPVSFTDGTLTLATSDPFDIEPIEAVAHLLDVPIAIAVAPRSDIDEALARMYPSTSISVVAAAAVEQKTSVDEDDVQRLLDSASEAPVIRFVNRIIATAVEKGASDVHIEPFVDILRVRIRLDGELHEVERQPLGLQAGVASRIKILAKLNIAERRRPQDGRAKFIVAGREVDMRVSTAPVIYGESVVLRILDKDRVKLDLGTLGFGEEMAVAFQHHLRAPNGIVLVTGPTGSGKTTTLYAALELLNDTRSKIFTVEDPIEYELAGINQIQARPEIGLDFATTLRSLLRQDPDVMMVGEMRDNETVRIAIQAALTGHLVLSTLHTNSAAASITRLVDMGAEDYLLASTIRGIIAQRLVRTLCTVCAEPASPNDPAFDPVINLPASVIDNAIGGGVLKLRKPRGCEQCSGSGYRGRTTIAELLNIDDSIRPLIRRGVTEQEIATAARSRGMLSLYECGLIKVAEGRTTIDEVMTATRN